MTTFMITDSPQGLSNLYLQIENLLLIESAKDPPSDPYKSKYKAKDLLEVLKIQLQLTLSNDAHKDAMLAHIWLQLGIICVDTDEVKEGEDSFNACIELINNKKTTPECIITCISVYNNLGLVWSQRSEWQKAFGFLGAAEKYYNEFSTNQLEPIDPGTLFTGKQPEEKVSSLQKLYTLTLYYLAQCYMHKGDSIQSAVYCHTTLKRQLEYNDYNNSEWSLNMATLSQVCLKNNAFILARECLYIASKIHADYEPLLNEMKSKNDAKYETEHETWTNVSVDINRCWGKYGHILLTVSKERLMLEDDPTNMKMFEAPDELKKLSIGVNLVQSDPSPITADYILTYSDALPVFSACHKHLRQAQTRLSLSEHATDHTRVVQEISALYQALVFFVESEAERCKFLKRCIDALEIVVKQLNPKYYVTLCREIWYELGEIYSEMFELKTAILKRTEQPTQHQIAKINWLIKNSLTQYIQFIQSFKNTRNDEYPSKYAEEWEKPILLAFFYSARLLSKIMTNDKVQLKKNLTEAVDNYKYILEYCGKNSEAADKFTTELPLCQKMVQLLSLKIERTSTQIAPLCS